MENKMMEILKEICSWYNYEITINQDGSINCYNCKEYDFTYKNLKVALKDWLITLEETDKDMVYSEEEPMWTEEINFIKNID